MWKTASIVPILWALILACPLAAGADPPPAVNWDLKTSADLYSTLVTQAEATYKISPRSWSKVEAGELLARLKAGSDKPTAETLKAWLMALCVQPGPPRWRRPSAALGHA